MLLVTSRCGVIFLLYSFTVKNEMEAGIEEEDNEMEARIEEENVSLFDLAFSCFLLVAHCCTYLPLMLLSLSPIDDDV